MPARRTSSRPRELHILSNELQLVGSLLECGRSGPMAISITGSPNGWTICAGRRLRVRAATMREAHERFVCRLEEEAAKL